MFLSTDSTISMVWIFVINNTFAVNYLRVLSILVPRIYLVCLYRSLFACLVSREIKVIFPSSTFIQSLLIIWRETTNLNRRRKVKVHSSAFIVKFLLSQFWFLTHSFSLVCLIRTIFRISECLLEWNFGSDR